MRKLFLLMMPVLMVSCIQNQEKQEGRIYLSGNINKENVTRIELVSRYDTIVAPVKPGDSWELDFIAGKAIYYVLSPANIQLFLCPGDSLHVDMELEGSEHPVSFSGKGEKINQFLQLNKACRNSILEDTRYKGQLLPNVYIWEILEESEVDSFIAHLYHAREKLMEPLVGFENENKVNNPDFIYYETERVDYLIAEIFERLRYFTRHKNTLTDKFYRELNGFDLNDENLLQLEEYITFLDNYTLSKGIEIVEADEGSRIRNNALTRGRYEYVKNNISNTAVRDNILYEMIRIHLTDFDAKNLEDLLEDFRNSCTNQTMVDRINDLYEKEMELDEGHVILPYKQANKTSLDAHIFYPDDHDPKDKRPVMVCFHGGGWYIGKPSSCFDYCEYFASLGMVCISAEYRLAPKHLVSPLESLADTKSMIRWVRENAGKLGIDPGKIVACGYSAGGQLAAGAAIFHGYEDINENLAVSSVPDVVGLWYSCVNTVYDSWFNMLCKNSIDPISVSPMHNVKPGLPPTIVFQGTEDTSVPIWTHREFCNRMKEAGNICKLIEFEGRPHSFTSIDQDDKRSTMKMMEAFLISLWYDLDLNENREL